MDFLQYWQQLLAHEKTAFCNQVGFSYGYVTTRLIYKARKPSLEKIDLMVKFSKGKLTHESIIKFFINKEKAPVATNN